jgi:hypothetical protein
MIRTLLPSPFTIDRAGSLYSPTAAPAFYFLLGNVLAAFYTVSLYGLLVPSAHSIRSASFLLKLYGASKDVHGSRAWWGVWGVRV